MKVLCAVDGSQFSHWAVESLCVLAHQPPRVLNLVHVLDTRAITVPGGGGRVSLKRTLPALEEEGTKLLHRMAVAARAALSQQAAPSMTKTQSILAQGPVAETIVKQARRRRVDLVIVGSRGSSDIRGFLLGSVSRRVVAHAPCPVLVVRRRLPEAVRVVLAVDSSKRSKAAAQFLLARLVGEATQVIVLSVVAPVGTDLAAHVLTPAELQELTKPREAQTRDLVAQYREMFLKEGCAVRTEVLAGHPSRTIVQYLEEHEADLVAVGSRGLSGPERFQLGSVSETVLKYAPCSVLVVR